MSRRSDTEERSSTLSSRGGGAGAAGFNGAGFDFSQFQDAFNNGFGFDFSDVFSDFFAGSPRQRRGRDISIDLEVSFKESVFGTKRTVLLAKTSQCSTCKGSGAEPGSSMETCKHCNGQGRVHETQNSVFGAITMQSPCRVCRARSRGSSPSRCAASSNATRGTILTARVSSGG